MFASEIPRDRTCDLGKNFALVTFSRDLPQGMLGLVYGSESNVKGVAPEPRVFLHGWGSDELRHESLLVAFGAPVKWH